jgi:Fe-S-cluster-containing dehydrogenase component
MPQMCICTRACVCACGYAALYVDADVDVCRLPVARRRAGPVAAQANYKLSVRGIKNKGYRWANDARILR